MLVRRRQPRDTRCTYCFIAHHEVVRPEDVFALLDLDGGDIVLREGRKHVVSRREPGVLREPGPQADCLVEDGEVDGVAL